MAINIRIGTAFNPKGLNQAQTQFQKFGASLQKGLRVATVAAAAITAIGMVGARFAKMAEEAQVANNRLDQVASSMGLFGDQTSVVTDRLKAYADQNKFVLGADDEVIKSTQAKLLTFKNLAATADIAGGAFDRATQAAFDLAATGFGQAETNAVQLGKALQDPIKGITALTRSGITFTEAERNLIRTLVESGNTLKAQEMILGAIEAQVGGTAEATATASTKMSIAFGEIGEAIGTSVLPLFEAFANWIVEITPSIETFFTNLTDPTTDVGQAWLNMSSSVVQFGETFVDVFGKIEASPLFKLIANLLETIFIGLTQIIWAAGDAGDTLGKLFSGDFAGAANKIQTFFSRYNSFVQQLYKDIDAGAARMASNISNMKVAPRVQLDFGGTGTGTGGSRSSRSVIGSLTAQLKREGRIAKREAQLVGAGLSEALAARITSQAKPIRAANRVLARITATGGRFATVLQNRFNRTAAGQAELAQIAAKAQAAAEAAAEAARQQAEELARIQEEAAQREAEALAERERIYNSFLDSVKQTFGEIRDSIMGAFDIKTLGSSTNSIIRNMNKLLTATRTFSSNITKLSSMGLSPELLAQVIQAGPLAGSRLAAALVAGGAGAIAEINTGFTEFGSLASGIATTGTESRFMTPTQQNIYNINVDGGVGSGATIGKAIVDAIKAYERTSGAVWQGA